jgi:plasmid stabilization system protein ParE
MPPSARKRLDWAEAALEEFDAAMRFYAERNPSAADRMADEITQAAQLLIDPFPAPGRPGIKAGTFERVIGRRTPFTLFYRERAGVVQILRVLHQARKYP